MAKRSRLKMTDSFEAIFRDLERASLDGKDVIRKEMATAISVIIARTPVRTGQAAAGWTPAADALGAQYENIASRRPRKAAGELRRSGMRRERSIARGRELGGYEEQTTTKGGKALNKAKFIAWNRDKMVPGLEYGWFNLHQAMHIVRNAMREMRGRIGPAFGKALRGSLRKPKRKVVTVVEG